MSELFEEEEPRRPERPAPRRSRALIITALVLIVAFFGLTTVASVYTDRLWYQSVGYSQVFSTLLLTKIGLFLVFGLLMGAVVGVNIFLAYRFRPLFRPASAEQTGLDRYRDAVTPIRTWLLIGVSLVIGLFAGASAVGQWRTYLLWRNAESFGTEDAYFKKDIGYYVFHLPWQHYLVDFAMAATVVALIAAAVVHYLYGGIRLQVSRDRLSGAAQVQISVLLGVFVLAKGVDYYLDRFDLVTDSNRIFTGMNNTADNAVLPAKNILLGIALICAVLFFLNIWRRTWQLPVVGLALLAVSSVLIGMIYPAIVQQFQVKPSEADKEASYIEENIKATRAAYELEDVETEAYTSNSTVSRDAAAQLNGELNSQVATAPLVDPKLVRQTFQQNQQGRVYYSVADVLDVDRYGMNGVERALVLGVRELDQSNLNPNDRNWNNLHTVYTHGSGVIAAYANQRGADNNSPGLDTQWAEGNQVVDGNRQDDLTQLTGGYESRIYFGEKSPDYSIVGRSSEDSEPVELSLPTTEEEEDQTTTYDGKGGVDIGSQFRQLMYAVKFGEPNFLLSGRVHGNSQLLYNRTPRERVEKVAPWLTIDDDLYPAIVDGRVVWIVDGYTTTDRYPLSQKESFATMTNDALQEETGLRTLPTDEINYMRNAVKATVDAYDGTVTLYAWDEEDPMLKAWRGAFPDTVKDRDEIPDELLEHLRYPEDLFKVQRYQYARYHITDPGDFYQGNDRWEVPADPNSPRDLQPPYRLFVDQADPENPDRPAEDVWSLTSTFVPFGKENLASFVSVNSDATSEDYGKIVVRELTSQTVQGPGLIANEFSNDDEVRDALLPFQSGQSPPLFGNLLTLPVAQGLIYIEPVYAVRAGSTAGFPILRFVLVSYGGEVGIGTSMGKAIANALGVEDEGTGTGTGTGSGGGGNGGGQGDNGQGGGDEPTGTIDEQIRAALDAADRAMARANAALDESDLGTYKEQVDAAQRHIQRAIDLAEQRDAGEEGQEPEAGDGE